MSNSQRAAELNNLGVVQLSQGDLRGALDRLRESLSFTSGSLIAPYSSQTSTNSLMAVPASTIGTSRPVTSLRVAAHHTAPFTPTATHSASSAGVARHNYYHVSPFLHSKGISMLPMVAAYSSDIHVNMAIVSSIVIFNMAIVCHLKGLEGGPESNSKLLRAKSLYERSQRLLTDASIPGDYSLGNPVTDMIAMASTNNLAQLNFEMMQYDESCNCFDRLIRFACTIVPGHYGNAYVGSLMDQAKSNFLLNAIILQKPGLASAA
jgi:hypothetical protein